MRMVVMHCSVVLYKFSFVAGEGVVERFDEGIFIDEIARPFCPRREDFFLFHLVKRFLFVEGLLHHGGSFFQHFGEGAHVIEIRDGAVPGNYFHVRR